MLTVLKRFGNFIKHNGISLQKKKPCTPRTGSQCARLHIMGSLPRISLTQTELFNERTIRIGIAALEVIQQFAATADHAHQATARMVVFHVCFELAGKFVATSRKQDRQTVVSGTSVSVRVDLGGRRIIKKKNKLRMLINRT